MPQEKAWEKEYLESRFITKHDKPQKFILRFLKYLKKEEKVSLENLRILDFGSGTGRNSNYLASLGARVEGIEISREAINLARKRAVEMNLNVKYMYGNIGEKLIYKNDFFDLALDATSSASLNEKERAIFLEEAARVLKEKGLFFTRALCKDGDKNAKKLLKKYPGKEKDTYVLPSVGIVERVFSQEDFVRLYSKYFTIKKIIKESGYSKFNSQSYKRNFLLAYLEK
jgi:SAM-dependent methyltransferase